MALTLIPLRGIDISLVRVTIQSVNASTGVLTDSATIGTITAVLKGAGQRTRLKSAEVSPITSPRENNIPLQLGYEVVLQEILDKRASTLPSTGPVLAKLADTLKDPTGFPYAKIEITRGGNTYTYKALFSDYNEGPYTREENIGEMTFLPIDDGVNYPIYS